MQLKLLRRYSLLCSVIVGAVAIAPSSNAQDRKEQIQTRIDRLTKAIEENVEARRAAEKLESSLALLEAVAGDQKRFDHLKVLDRFSPGLLALAEQVPQLELERDLIRDQLGSQNPRFKSLSDELQKQRASLEKKTAEARGKLESELKEARVEAERARANRDQTRQKVDTLKEELLTFIGGR